MKKFAALILIISMSITLFACKAKEGDLGKQTTVDKENGYTLVQEVRNFSFNKDEDEIEKNPKAKFDGFVTGEKNPAGDIKIKSDALKIAQNEVKFKYNKINYYYDRTRGVWKIVFSKDTVKEDKQIDSVVLGTVYVDEDGYTLATVFE